MSTRSVTEREYGNFLMTVFDEWVRRDVVMCSYNCSTWRSRLGWASSRDSTFSRRHVAVRSRCSTTAISIAVTTSSSRVIYSAICTSESWATWSIPPDNRSSARRSGTPSQSCHDCEVRFVCNGGCTKNRFISTPDGEPGLNYLCEGYRAFFNHIDPAMRYMADALRDRQPPRWHHAGSGTDVSEPVVPLKHAELLRMNAES